MQYQDMTTNKTRLNKKGFSVIEIVLSLSILIIVILLGLFIWQHQKAQPNLSIFNANSGIKPAANGRYFIMSAQVLNWMVANPQARLALKDDTVFVINNSKIKLASQTNGLNLIDTEDFTSEAKLSVNINNLPSGTKAILYDNEPWTYTPVNEQSNPLYYYQQASLLATQHHLILIATPVIKDKSNINSLVQIAEVANVFDIQSQYDQNVTSAYSGHVVPIAQAITKSSPKTIILSGLSTNPRAGIPTPTQLVNDAQAVAPYVKGYWLNIPNKPSNCSTIKHSNDGRCAGPQPQIGIEFLILLK